MFPTIDDSLVCERVLGWVLIDRDRDIWRLPDGSTQVGTPPFSADAPLTRAIEAALEESPEESVLPTMAANGWFDAPDDIGPREGEEDWTANYHIECAIARATRRLIEQGTKARN